MKNAFSQDGGGLECRPALAGWIPYEAAWHQRETSHVIDAMKPEAFPSKPLPGLPQFFPLYSTEVKAAIETLAAVSEKVV